MTLAELCDTLRAIPEVDEVMWWHTQGGATVVQVYFSLADGQAMKLSHMLPPADVRALARIDLLIWVEDWFKERIEKALTEGQGEGVGSSGITASSWCYSW